MEAEIRSQKFKTLAFVAHSGAENRSQKFGTTRNSKSEVQRKTEVENLVLSHIRAPNFEVRSSGGSRNSKSEVRRKPKFEVRSSEQPEIRSQKFRGSRNSKSEVENLSFCRTFGRRISKSEVREEPEIRSQKFGTTRNSKSEVRHNPKFEVRSSEEAEIRSQKLKTLAFVGHSGAEF